MNCFGRKVLLAAFVWIANNGWATAQELPSGDVKLARIPAKSPEEALKSFELLPGFEMELVASEPLVVDPVAMAFDPQGRMLVIEMIDYSEMDQDHLGRLRRLEDTNRDGKMDRVETLASGLSWPTALAITEAGILVVHPPKLSLVQEKSPGKFSVETIAEGFSRSNVQGMANSFRWGLDNRWHLSTSSTGASLSGRGLPNTMELKGRDIALNPKDWSWVSEPGGGQHGMDFNRWGDKFVSSNSDHLQQIVAWNFAGLSSGSLADPIALRRSIAIDGPQADVFRLSPVEGWRTWRTQLRVTGKVKGPIEGGGRAAGYFTGATGVTIYDGDQWSDEEEAFAIVADVGGNLVHRKRLIDSGLQWSGQRIDQGTELIRSADLWFRPVQFGDGPDGCLYVLDMYREVIEHPASLPPVIKSQLDLNSGNDRGRIWRLRKKDRPIRRQLDPLDALPTEQLATMVEHPNGWHRETAARLLYERQDKSAIEPLRKIARSSARPEGRLQALASLAGLESGVDQPTLLRAIQDPHPRVASFAIMQLPKSSLQGTKDQSIVAALKNRINDPSIHVRMAIAALGLEWFEPSKQSEWLVSIAGEDWKRNELRGVVESSIQGSSLSLLKNFVESQEIQSIHGPWIRSFLFQGIRSSGVQPVLELIQSQLQQGTKNGDRLLLSFADLANKNGGSFKGSDRAFMEPWLRKLLLPRVQTWLKDKKVPIGSDAESTYALVGFLDLETRKQLLQTSLENEQPTTLQLASVRTLPKTDNACAEIMMGRLAQMGPEVHSTILRQVARRKETATLIFRQLEQGSLESNKVPTDVWTLLEQHADVKQKETFKKFRGTSGTTSWDSIAERYQAAWDHTPNLETGSMLFKKHCAACHKVGDLGNEIGPGLASILGKSNDQIGLAVAEPSREVDPKYQVYQLLTTDGELFVGIMEDSNPQSIILRDAKGEQKRVERESIEKFSTVGKSLMPDGLMEQLDPESFNHLIGFLRTALRK